MKLRGLRVVDLSVFLPGPYLTQALADHGAEVIKVEPPGGDPGRGIGPADGPSTVFFRGVNRGKRSVVLDLKAEAGCEALRALADGADVFVESFRPGVVDRLGVGPATLRARNPRLVTVSISAFGATGPYRDRPAHDLAVEALAGAVGLNRGPDGRPAIPGVAAADILAALQGLSGVLMALLRREATGRGDHLDLSMHEAVLAAYPNVIGPVLAEGREPAPAGERSNGGSAFYRLYATRDGRHLALGGGEPKFVRALLAHLGRPDLAPLVEAGPGPHQAPAMAFLEAAFAGRDLADWLAELAPLDLCYAPVNTVREALDDPQARARGMVLTDARGRTHLAPVLRFAEEPPVPDLVEPALGADTAAVLAGLAPRDAPRSAA